MFESKLFHPSSKPTGHGITIGTPLLYDLSARCSSSEPAGARTAA